MMSLRDGAKILKGAALMGLVWALAWGGIVGGTIELVANVFPNWEFAKLADIWPAELGLRGFIAGAVFSVLLSVAERSRRFEELSLGRFAALGATAGLLLTGLMAIGALGSSALPAFLTRVALISIPMVALGAATSSSVLLLARWAGETRLRLK